jgi:hypothetical protein
MKAKEILTETEEQMVELSRKFRKKLACCEFAKPGKIGVGQNHTVVRCNHKDYDHYAGPNCLCLFDYCPIIQKGLLDDIVNPKT